MGKRRVSEIGRAMMAIRGLRCKRKHRFERNICRRPEKFDPIFSLGACQELFILQSSDEATRQILNYKIGITDRGVFSPLFLDDHCSRSSSSDGVLESINFGVKGFNLNFPEAHSLLIEPGAKKSTRGFRGMKRERKMGENETKSIRFSCLSHKTQKSTRLLGRIGITTDLKRRIEVHL